MSGDEEDSDRSKKGLRKSKGSGARREDLSGMYNMNSMLFYCLNVWVFYVKYVLFALNL